MRPEDLRALALFDGLSGEQLAQLAEAGSEVVVEPGQELFHEGDHADSWWVLVEGAVELVRRVGREDVVVGRMDVPGRWAGGFRAWDEHGVYLASARVATAARLLQVPAAALGELADVWFPFAAHLVRGLYGTARTIEATVRQRASLVALGELAAGFAHELNNPAAAAVRAVDGLDAASQALVASLGRLVERGISPAQFAALDALRREVPGARAGSDPLRLSEDEDAVEAWLDRRGVARAWSLAPALAAAGVDVQWCERAAAVLPGPVLEPGVEWVASSLDVASLLSDVGESTRRISTLVGAVRSYSQMDRGSLQLVDVTDGLESTLVMLGHKLGHRVDVDRSYGPDVPRVQAYAGELNQVWTNLMDNALDAMDGAGVLGVATRGDDGGVVVEISDTGQGMPPDVAERAFEPFYTTKAGGQRTGLGLDIARRIVVERHGGEIAIESRPGLTVVRVRIPARPSV
jgi:signal transduction histidine kinase